MREESKKYGRDTGSREQDRETKESLRKIAMEPTQRATSTGTGRLTTPEGQPQLGTTGKVRFSSINCVERLGKVKGLELTTGKILNNKTKIKQLKNIK